MSRLSGSITVRRPSLIQTPGIHTGGRETGDFPPFEPPPPLNQHKYYISKMVLKQKQH